MAKGPYVLPRWHRIFVAIVIAIVILVLGTLTAIALWQDAKLREMRRLRDMRPLQTSSVFPIAAKHADVSAKPSVISDLQCPGNGVGSDPARHCTEPPR